MKVETPKALMPRSPAEMTPELVMPPPALLEPKTVAELTSMPAPCGATIVPLLAMPPKKVVTPLR